MPAFSFTASPVSWVSISATTCPNLVVASDLRRRNSRGERAPSALRIVRQCVLAPGTAHWRPRPDRPPMLLVLLFQNRILQSPVFTNLLSLGLNFLTFFIILSSIMWITKWQRKSHSHIFNMNKLQGGLGCVGSISRRLGEAGSTQPAPSSLPCTREEVMPVLCQYEPGNG